MFCACSMGINEVKIQWEISSVKNCIKINSMNRPGSHTYTHFVQWTWNTAARFDVGQSREKRVEQIRIKKKQMPAISFTLNALNEWPCSCDMYPIVQNINHSCTRTQELYSFLFFPASALCSFDAINEYLIYNKYRLFIIIPILFAVACSAIVG